MSLNWCNEVYYNAIPSTLRPIFKQYQNVTANNGKSASSIISNDYFALPAEREVFGSRTYANNTLEGEMKIVTKEEFNNFLKSYPHPLERDWYMDWFSWNDFSDGKVWPESVVAMCSDGSYDEPITYKIMEEDKE